MLLLLLAACQPAKDDERPPRPPLGDDTGTTDSTATLPDDAGTQLPEGCTAGTAGPTALTMLAQVRDEEITSGHLDIVDMIDAGGLVYGAGLGGLIPVSVVDPAQPRVLFHDPTVRNRYTHIELLSKGLVAAVHPDRGLDIYDVSYPELPVVIGGVDATGWDGLAFVAPYLYVGAGDGTLVTLDLTDPTAPVVVGVAPGLGTPWEIEPAADGVLYVADHALGLVPVDISDPTAPLVGVPFPLGGSPYDVAVEGDLLYVALGSEGVAIVDGSDPTAPSLVSTFPTSSTAIQVDVDGGWVVVADRVGITIVDAHAPAAPTPFTRVDTDQYAMAAAIRGRTVFVGDWEWFETWSLDTDVIASAADLLTASATRSDGLATFRVTNRGAGSLSLDGATASDGTSTVWTDRRRLAPGEEGEIRVWGGSGAVEVCVQTNDPRQPTLSLSVDDGGVPPVGIVAPDFTLSDTLGVSHTLSDERGRPVFIGFFATW